MNYNDVRTVLMGIGWILFFFAPLVLASIPTDNNNNGIFTKVLFVTALQLILVLSIGHSWQH